MARGEHHVQLVVDARGDQRVLVLDGGDDAVAQNVVARRGKFLVRGGDMLIYDIADALVEEVAFHGRHATGAVAVARFAPGPPCVLYRIAIEKRVKAGGGPVNEDVEHEVACEHVKVGIEHGVRWWNSTRKDGRHGVAEKSEARRKMGDLSVCAPVASTCVPGDRQTGDLLSPLVCWGSGCVLGANVPAWMPTMPWLVVVGWILEVTECGGRFVVRLAVLTWRDQRAWWRGRRCHRLLLFDGRIAAMKMEVEAFCCSGAVKSFNLKEKYDPSPPMEQEIKVGIKSVRLARAAWQRFKWVEKSRWATSRDACKAMWMAKRAPEKEKKAAWARYRKMAALRDDKETKRKWCKKEWERFEKLRIKDMEEREREARQPFDPNFFLPEAVQPPQEPVERTV